jgi:hypothetical protein
VSNLLIGAAAYPAYARSDAADPGHRLDEDTFAAMETFEDLRPRFPSVLGLLLAAVAEHFAVPVPLLVARWAPQYGPGCSAEEYQDVVRAYLTFLEAA